MTETSLRVEERIATLPIAEADCKRALAYVKAGEGLAEVMLAIARFFSSHSTPMLSHNH